MRIIFMGSPAFAVPSLQALIESNSTIRSPIEVVAVFTQSPKESGRGMSVSRTAIHELVAHYAPEIPVYTPKTMRSDDVYDIIKNIMPDVIVVVAYGFIIPQRIIDIPKYGCINIHPSALPKFRGAAPMQRTILSGDNITSVCTMQMDAGMDTGDIILSNDIELNDQITFHELHDTCANIGASLLLETIDNIGNLPRIKQSDIGVSYANKISKEESLVDFTTEDAVSIHRKIRAFTPWPGVSFVFKDNIKDKSFNVKIISATVIDENDIVDSPPRPLTEIVCANNTYLRLDSVQLPSKKPISGEEFFRNYSYR